MFSPSNQDAEEDFDQVLYVLIPIGIVVTHYASWKFYEGNPEALFKVGMLVWYGVACWLTVAYLAFDFANLRFADKFFVYFYNCAAQLISFTGIVDCGQFFWCIAHMQTISQTNMKFFKIYALCCVITLMIFVVIFTLQLPLHFYRIISLLVITTEVGGYMQMLRIGWDKFNRSSIIYFIVTSGSRLGIAIGVVLRMTLGDPEEEIGQQGQQVGFIHCMSVMFTLGVVVVFVDEIKIFLDDLNSNNTMRTKTSSPSISLAENIHIQLSE